ncbi:MAG: bifunctional ornithine acetyltransferase/N-acetylglutamate synthase, partial [Gammaproteobacteria bacterium]
MAVGLHNLPELLPVAGLRLGTARAGIKYPERRDLVLMELAAG